MQKNNFLEEGALIVLNAIPGSAAVIDQHGKIVETNRHWNSKSISNWLGIKPEGINYFDHCRKAIEKGNDYALKILLGIRDVLDNPDKNIEQIISIISNGQKHWSKVSISKLNGSDYVLLIFDDVTTNMNATQALRESEERYSQHFKHSVSGILIGTPDGKILDANPAACKILGYTKEELKQGGRNLIVNVDDPAHRKMMNIRNKTAFFEGEKEYIHKNGHSVPIHITSVLHRNQDGEMQIINTFRDKSTEKHVQHSLDEERRFTRTAIDSIPGIFFVIDKSLKIVRWNNTIEDNLGYHNNQLSSMGILQLVHPEDEKEVYKQLENIFKAGQGEFATRVLDRQGNTRTYHMYLNRFKNKKEEFLVSTGVDITEFLALEKEKSEQYALMKQLFENSPLATIMIEPDNKVKRVNKAFTELFGYSKDEVLGNNVNSLITDDQYNDESEKMSRNALNGIASQKETIRFNKEKEKVPVLINTVPIKNNGDIIAAYGIYVDLSDQKRLEKELQRSLSEKDVLLQEVHHRVKNNLAIITGMLELQIMHNDSQQESNQLKEALTRIFSISTIHETLYQHEDVVSIRFDKYLDKIASTLPHRMNKQVTQISKDPDSEHLKLNLNQAVPLGLVINELINLGTAKDAINENIVITINSDNLDVNLTIDGINPEINELKSGLKSDTFHKLLIKTFLDQINAKIRLIEDETAKIVISFRRSDTMKGSSSSITDQYNLQKKQYIIKN